MIHPETTDAAPDTAVNAATPAIETVGISKRFSGTTVLDRVSLTIAQGSVHGVVGENGAGKSTLGKIIGGYYRHDAGEVRIFGETALNWTPRNALARGVAMIHQELSLVPARTVAENVFLGAESHRRGVLLRDENERLEALDSSFGFGLNPRAVVSSLRIANQQKVEIMRALARDARIIIMDEPTSSLTPDETERLHAVMAELRRSGRTVVYVSHFLEHVLEQCDQVTVMRDGCHVRTADCAEESKHSLVEAMLGRAVNVAFPPRARGPGNPDLALEVRNLATDTGLRDVSLSVATGEIVGLLGLVGSGRTEVARAVFGIDRPTGGEVRVNGADYRHPSPRKSIRKGLVMIPEDRRKLGLVLSQRNRENVTLPHLERISRGGVIRKGEERSRVADLIRQLGVSPPGVETATGFLSGGNQQKVLFAKWMFSDPGILILDEPTRGVDVGARRKIFDIIVEIAERGTAILVISSELEEVLGLAHRGYLMRDGRTTGEVNCAEVSPEDVLRLLFAVGEKPESVVRNPEGTH